MWTRCGVKEGVGLWVVRRCRSEEEGRMTREKGGGKEKDGGELNRTHPRNRSSARSARWPVARGGKAVIQLNLRVGGGTGISL